MISHHLSAYSLFMTLNNLNLINVKFNHMNFNQQIGPNKKFNQKIGPNKNIT